MRAELRRAEREEASIAAAESSRAEVAGASGEVPAEAFRSGNSPEKYSPHFRRFLPIFIGNSRVKHPVDLLHS